MLDSVESKVIEKKKECCSKWHERLGRGGAKLLERCSFRDLGGQNYGSVTQRASISDSNRLSPRLAWKTQSSIQAPLQKTRALPEDKRPSTTLQLPNT